MRRTLEVALREYVETVKTKAFILSLLLTPLLIVGVLLLSIFLQEKSYTGDRPPRSFALVELGGDLGQELADAFSGYNDSHSNRRIILQLEETGYVSEARIQEHKEQVRDGSLDGLLVVLHYKCG